MGGAGSSLLKCFGQTFYGHKEFCLLMIGLDAGGKTTVLYKLKLGEIVTTIPTIGFNVETIQYKNIDFVTWDVGARDKARPLWRHYFKNTDALVFVVDSNDRERMAECRYELHRVMEDKELEGCVLLLLANKQDLPNALSIDEITTQLDLSSFSEKNIRWHIQGTCATKGEGLYEAFDWLAESFTAKSIKSSLSQPLVETASSTSDALTKPSIASSWFHSIGSFFSKPTRHPEVQYHASEVEPSK
ncbi:hypothetical protein EMCRGX_G026177 [Ephydatia muelleri]|eukprot:Em0021g911a